MGEDVIFSVGVDALVGALPPLKNCGIVVVLRCECLSEFSEVESSILVSIVTIDKTINVIDACKYSNVSKSMLQVCSRD